LLLLSLSLAQPTFLWPTIYGPVSHNLNSTYTGAFKNISDNGYRFTNFKKYFADDVYDLDPTIPCDMRMLAISNDLVFGLGVFKKESRLFAISAPKRKVEWVLAYGTSNEGSFLNGIAIDAAGNGYALLSTYICELFVVSFSYTGTKRWRIQLPLCSPESNLIIAGDRLFVAVRGSLFCLDLSKGSIIWVKKSVFPSNSDSGHYLTFDPTDLTIYLLRSDPDSQIYALSGYTINGSSRFEYTVPTQYYQRQAFFNIVVYKKNIYFLDSSTLFCVNNNKTLGWTVPNYRSGSSKPGVDYLVADYDLIIVNTGYKVVAYKLDGELSWQNKLDHVEPGDEYPARPTAIAFGNLMWSNPFDPATDSHNIRPLEHEGAGLLAYFKVKGRASVASFTGFTNPSFILVSSNRMMYWLNREPGPRTADKNCSRWYFNAQSFPTNDGP